MRAFKALAAAILFLMALPSPLAAQVPQTPSQLETLLNNTIYSNGTGAITAATLYPYELAVLTSFCPLTSIVGTAPTGYYISGISPLCAQQYTLLPAGGGGGTPGGSNGQVQYNNSGAFGGFTPSQDCTVNVTTGIFTCLRTNNVPFTTLATLAPGTGVATALGAAAGSSNGMATLNSSGWLPISQGGNGTNAPVLTAGSGINITGSWPNYTISSSVTGAPGGTSGQFQYNNGGAFGGFTMSGDATTNTTTGAFTLATVNTNVGSFGSATQSPTFTVNGKGLITAAANATITPAVGSITGLGTGVGTALANNLNAASGLVGFSGALGAPTATGLTLSSITGSTQCLQVNSSGVVAGSGSACAGALAFPVTVSGTTTSGGIPFFSNTTTLTSSGLLAANALMIGGGAGVAPSTTTTGTNVLTALSNNTEATGAFTRQNGAITAGHCLQWSATGVQDAGGACTVGGGGGTITASPQFQVPFYSAAGTSNTLTGSAAMTLNGGALAMGTAGSTVGSISFANATSGTITLSPPTGALGSVTLTLPAITSTLAVLGLAQSYTATQTFSGVTMSGITGSTQCLQVNTSGVVAGTGNACLSGTIAAASDVQAGTSSTAVVTPNALAGSANFQTLTDGATINWNVANGYNATLALTGNTHTLANPTNVIVGVTYVVIINPSTFTGFAFGSAYNFGAAGTPSLAASKDNAISCIAKTTSNLYCTVNLGF